MQAIKLCRLNYVSFLFLPDPGQGNHSNVTRDNGGNEYD